MITSRLRAPGPVGAGNRNRRRRDDLRGRFESIVVDGVEATAFYVREGLFLRIDD
jgi:hypothetical protein